MIKKILGIIFEPFRNFGTKGISEKLSNFLKRNSYLIYIIAFLVTALIILFIYFI